MVLGPLLRNLGAQQLHDLLVRSPTFLRAVQKTHDAVKGIKRPPHEYDPKDTGNTMSKISDFARVYKEELIDNFKKRK